MGTGTFHAFAALSQQPLAACPANPAAVAIHRPARLGFALPLPVPAPAIRFRAVGAQANRLVIDERLIAVIALVRDQFLQTAAVGLGHKSINRTLRYASTTDRQASQATVAALMEIF
jgi:hypothetical protein